MANLQKVVKVTQAQYDTLASGGTVGSYTGLNDNYIYLVQASTTGINVVSDILQGTGGREYVKYAPYTTKGAGHFYTGTTDPTSSNRLNYDGDFYSRALNARYFNFITDDPRYEEASISYNHGESEADLQFYISSNEEQSEATFFMNPRMGFFADTILDCGVYAYPWRTVWTQGLSYGNANNKILIPNMSSWTANKTIATLEDLCEPITWSSLKTLRDQSKLIPGKKYRITDYTCTTTQSDTSSAGHVFDIIVTAIANNKLDENAKAALHSGDTYFSSCNLQAWDLKYCIDNDIARFNWAQTDSTGRGVIYFMKDEFDNEVPYDFKNMLFTKTNSYISIYTFNYVDSNTNKDASLALSNLCYNNTIKPYYNTNKQYLNFNVWNNTTTNKSSFYNNYIGSDCKNNTFSYYCNNNTLGQGCKENSFRNGACDTTFYANCNSNEISSYSYYNILETNCSSNFITGLNNRLGAGCYYIRFISTCNGTIVDPECKFLQVTTANGTGEAHGLHIHSNVKGDSTTSLKTVTVQRGVSYETDVYQDESGNLIYKENNGISVIDLR